MTLPNPISSPPDLTTPPPSLDVLFEFVKDYIETQNKQLSTLDQKAGLVLGSASLLTAGILGFQSATLTAIGQLPPDAIGKPWLPWLVLVLVAIALGFYLGLVWAAYQAYRIREYSAVKNVRTLRNKYLERDPAYTKQTLLDTTIKVIETNEGVIADKVLWAERALRYLWGEAIFATLLIATQVAIQIGH